MIENNSDLSEHFGKNNTNHQKISENNSDTKENSYTIHDEEYYENIRKRMRERRILAEKRRVRRNRITAVLILLLIVGVIFIFLFRNKNHNDDNNGKKITGVTSSEISTDNSSAKVSKSENDKKVTEQVSSSENDNKDKNLTKTNKKIEKSNGLTFVDGILIANKTYSLPSTYKPQTSQVAYRAFTEMSNAAANEGITLFINSGYRSYAEQKELYDGYAAERGKKAADEVSSRPGHSEHQTGLSFDVNTTEFSFEGTPESNWLAKHCCEYGFIIRYPKGKEKQTGYAYEPWHIRYIGVEKAVEITKSGLCLEEYLGITSDYKYADN